MFRLPRKACLAFGLSAILALTFGMPAPSFADQVANATQQQAALGAAAQFVQNLGNRAIAVISNKQLTQAQRDDQFSQILSDSFDLKTIGRFVIGRSWNAATPEQQDQYMKLFKALVIKTYGSRMTLYTGEGFKVIGSRPESEMDTTVNSEITHPDGSAPTMIDWRVRNRDGKMGVIDVMVEGVSLSVTQRQEYAAIIQNNGGKIDALLKEMQDELNAPAPASQHS
ncbi:MAG: ABC transporter substrate-binding protein [Alphaproteobacteria bacterium]|nr:ABC transporter substrate-binding protein [Alphaproteobacteria bacterium]